MWGGEKGWKSINGKLDNVNWLIWIHKIAAIINALVEDTVSKYRSFSVKHYKGWRDGEDESKGRGKWKGKRIRLGKENEEVNKDIMNRMSDTMCFFRAEFL